MTDDQAKNSIMDLHVAGTKDQINMLEAGGNETPIEIIKKALELGQEAIKEICEIQEAFLSLCTITPQQETKNTPDDALIDAVRKVVGEERINTLFGKVEKGDRDRMFREYEALAKEALAEQIASEDNDRTEGQVGEARFQVVKKAIRKRTLEEGVRIDDRNPKEIRQIYCETNLFDRVHGT